MRVILDRVILDSAKVGEGTGLSLEATPQRSEIRIRIFHSDNSGSHITIFKKDLEQALKAFQ